MPPLQEGGSNLSVGLQQSYTYGSAFSVNEDIASEAQSGGILPNGSSRICGQGVFGKLGRSNRQGINSRKMGMKQSQRNLTHSEQTSLIHNGKVYSSIPSFSSQLSPRENDPSPSIPFDAPPNRMTKFSFSPTFENESKNNYVPTTTKVSQIDDNMFNNTKPDNEWVKISAIVRDELSGVDQKQIGNFDSPSSNISSNDSSRDTSDKRDHTTELVLLCPLPQTDDTGRKPNNEKPLDSLPNSMNSSEVDNLKFNPNWDHLAPSVSRDDASIQVTSKDEEVVPDYGTVSQPSTTITEHDPVRSEIDFRFFP
jgi:hypothetical protein